MGTSKTTTTVETGEMSPRGESYDSLFQELMYEAIGEAGYDIRTTQKTIAGKDGKPVPYMDYNLVKKPDIRVQDAIRKFGDGSPEARAAVEMVRQEKVDRASSMASVEKQYLINLNKYAAGDYSYTQSQYNQIDKFISPIKNLIMSTTQELLTQFGSDDAMLRESLGSVMSEIDKTGFAVQDALNAARIQVDASGKSLMEVLKGVNTSAESRARFQFDLLSEQADLQAAQQAAMFGLPLGSRAEHVASAKMKTDALKQIELDLYFAEATGSLQIQQGVEEGKQRISLSEVALASSQGEKYEEVSKMGFGLTQLLTNKIDQAMQSKANALIGTEQQRSQLLLDAAFGSLPGRTQAGQGALGFDQNKKASEQSRMSGLMGSVAQQLGIEQQRSFAETTTETKKKKSFLDTFTDILGAGIGAAGSIFGMAGGGGGGGGGGDSGGSSAPQTFMPQLGSQTYNQQPFYLDWKNG